ncbi:FecR family protein [Sphingobium aromaticiconvertens]|uniref:FecR family protein n=1 Tax=Sphingobium aromaticiconvertens TaxID=365341 RepID=UPI003019EF50
MVDPTGEGRSDDQIREEAAAWLARLRDSSDTQDYEAFADWYSADIRHADLYDEVLASWDETASAGLTPAGEANSQAKSAQPTKNGGRLMLAAAACIVIALALVCLHALSAAGNPKRADELASGIGEIRTLSLPDGSKVTLDAGSVVIVDYGDQQRHLLLQRGRARFDVAHDAVRPFIVSAGNGDVIAHGTIFDVDLQGQRMTVSLLRGSVEVKRHFGTRQGQFLMPGESAFVEDGAPSEPEPISAGARDWPTGVLSFSNAELGDVARLANRHAAAGIIIVSPDAAQLKFTGTMVADDTAGLAKLLAATFGLSLNKDRAGNFLLAVPAKKLPG